MSDLSKITLPNGSSYDLKDATARSGNILSTRPPGEWAFFPSSLGGGAFYVEFVDDELDEGIGDLYFLHWDDGDGEYTVAAEYGEEDDLSVSFTLGSYDQLPSSLEPYDQQTVTATRTVPPGYVLGSQTSKPLADADHTHSYNDLSDKPAIPSVSGKADSASVAPAFSASSTYALGDVVTYNGVRYKCTTAISTAAAWDASKWTAETVQTVVDGLKARDVVVVTGEWSNGSIGSLSHTFAQVVALVSAGTPVMAVVYDPTGVYAAHTVYQLAHVGVPSQGSSVIDRLVFSSVPDADWEGMYYFVWTSSGIASGWRQIATNSSEKVFMLSVELDTTTDPPTVENTTWAWDWFYDNSGSNPILRMTDSNTGSVVNLQGVFASIYDDVAIFSGIFKLDGDDVLIEVFLGPPDTEGGNDNWLVEIVPLASASSLSQKQDSITASGILKGNGSGTVSAAVAGTDYQAPLPSASGQNGKVLGVVDSNDTLGWVVPAVQQELRYAIVTPTATTSTTDSADDTISAVLQDRAVNIVTAGSGTDYVNLTFPASEQGYARDFFVRLVLTGTDVPAVSFSESGGGEVEFDVDDDSWAEIDLGVNLLMFTETSQASGSNA